MCARRNVNIYTLVMTRRTAVAWLNRQLCYSTPYGEHSARTVMCRTTVTTWIGRAMVVALWILTIAPGIVQ